MYLELGADTAASSVSASRMVLREFANTLRSFPAAWDARSFSTPSASNDPASPVLNSRGEILLPSAMYVRAKKAWATVMEATGRKGTPFPPSTTEPLVVVREAIEKESGGIVRAGFGGMASPFLIAAALMAGVYWFSTRKSRGSALKRRSALKRGRRKRARATTRLRRIGQSVRRRKGR